MKKDLTPKVRFDGYKKAWKKEKLSRIVDVKNGMDYKHLQRGDIPVYGTRGTV